MKEPIFIRPIQWLPLALLVFMMTSFLMNIYRLASCDFEPSYKAEVIYAIGIFCPTFIVTAWMDLEK